MKAPVRWYIYWKVTTVWDWQIPGLTFIARIIRNWTFVWEDHKLKEDE